MSKTINLYKSFDKHICKYTLERNEKLTTQIKDKIIKILNTNVQTLQEIDSYRCKIANKHYLVEIQSKFSESPEVTNIKNIFKKIGISRIKLKISRIIFINEYCLDSICEYYDKITETITKIVPLTNLPKHKQPTDTTMYNEQTKINSIEDLQEIDNQYGLGLSEQDKQYIMEQHHKWKYPLFMILDIAQSNSEHCRHHFFNGNLVLNNIKLNNTLFNLVKKPLYNVNKNLNNKASLVAFSDNSSVICGYKTNTFLKSEYNQNYKYTIKSNSLDFLLTAETHNFPTGIEPFSGASTGIGGRIRDSQSTGRGAYPIASSAGYCVGDIFNTSIEDYPSNMARPMDILIEASNGASDYGNKFGEPIILGFTRSFSSQSHYKKYATDNIRHEWVKPIMFTGGLGHIFRKDLYKSKATENMQICKIGGPVYKIGFGGSSASSKTSDEASSIVDANAVQRGDPEMEQKLDKVIRTCIELGNNPIESLHDQGAGGNANVLKEI